MTLDSMDYWRLAEELSVVDAAILLTGNDPSNKHDDNEGNLIQSTYYEGFDAGYKALKNAVLSNKIKARVSLNSRDAIEQRNSPGQFGEYETSSEDELNGYKTSDEGQLNYHNLIIVSSEKAQIRTNLPLRKMGTIFYLREPNWEETTIEVEEVKRWLKTRGIYPDFYFPKGSPDGFRDVNNPRFSPKLACAIAAWEAVKGPAKNQSVKQSIEAWLTSNAVNYGMAGNDGVVPDGAIREVARVVNWDPKGGVPKTGAGYEEENSDDSSSEIDNFVGSYKEFDADTDSEIPF